MSSIKVSGSVMGRVVACPASAVLPHVKDDGSDASRRGQDIHAYLRNAHVYGRIPALQMIEDDELRRECADIDMGGIAFALGDPSTRQPDAYELAIVYDTETDTARVVGENIDREYGALESTEIPMSMDVVRVHDDIALIIDYKTGATAMTAEQAYTQAVGVARAFGVDAVAVTALYLQDDGSWRPVRTEYTAWTIDAYASQLKDTMGRVEAAQVAYAAGQTPDVTTGAHCRWCPAKLACPATTALVKSMPSAIAETQANGLIPLETLGRVYADAKRLKEMMESYCKAIEEQAITTPIPLPNGGTLKEVETTRETIDGAVARYVLESIDPELAAAAIEPTTSKAAIKRAVEKRMPDKKAVTSTVNKICAALGANGAITTKVYKSVKESK